MSLMHEFTYQAYKDLYRSIFDNRVGILLYEYGSGSPFQANNLTAL